MKGLKRKRSTLTIKEDYFEEEEENLSEYEKIRLKNIADRQLKFNELKIEDKVLDLSSSLIIEKPKRNVSRRGLSAVVVPKEKVFEPVRKSLRLQKIDADTGISLPEKEPTRYHSYENEADLRPPLKDLSIEELTNNNNDDELEKISKYFGDQVKPYITDTDHKNHAGNSIFHDIKNLDKNLKKLKITPERVAKVVPNRIFSIAIHPTQSKVLIAAGGKWGSIGFWDVLDTESAKHGVQVIKHHSRPVNCLSFDDYDSSRLISTSYDGSVRLFDINQQKSSILFAYPEEDSNFYCNYHCQIDSHNFLVSVGKAGISLIDSRLSSSKAVSNFKVYDKASPKMVSVHPLKKEYFLAPSSKGDCAIFDTRMATSSKLMKPLINLYGHTKSLSSAKFSPLTGSKVVTVAYDNKIRLFNTSEEFKQDLKPYKSISHNNQTGRWLTTFKAEWHPQNEDIFFVGSMNQPRQMDVVTNKGNLSDLYALKGEDLASVCSIVKCHPSKDIIVGGNSSGRVHVFM